MLQCLKVIQYVRYKVIQIKLFGIQVIGLFGVIEFVFNMDIKIL